ncbi:MAG TPA: ABC transporter substrate-binding protein, partial [Rhizomicrobium sp.]
LIHILALSVVAGTVANAATPVETFVQQNIDHGIALLKDTSLDDAVRRQQLAQMMAELLDTRKMALFMIADVRDKTAPSDLDAYVEAYKTFTIANYESQLSGFGGQSLKVTGSIQRAPGDYVVNAVLVDPAAPNDPNALPIGFRVVEEADGKYGVVDASVAGIWLGLAQRSEFSGYLSQHGNSVPQLTAHLQEMAANLSAAATTASSH